jgi:hypothetical protein
MRDSSDIEDEAEPVERRAGGLAVLGGAVLGGIAAAVVLVALLVLSPASFVSLLPDWFVEDGSSRAAAWIVAGLSASAAGALALRRGRAGRFRVVAVTVLLLVAAAYGTHALRTASEPPPRESTCVAYSGGRHTCPGG